MPEALPAASTTRRGINPSKFMGASFAAGKGLEEKVNNNSRKITLLKNIIKEQKITTGEKLASLSPSADNKEGLQSMVASIAASVGSIKETLLKQQEFDKKTALKAGQEEEKDKRTKREKLLESKVFKAFTGTAQKILSPVKSVFDQVIDFISTIIFGRVIMKLIDWWADPANGKKMQSIIKFTKDYWPAILAGVVLFGTSFGGMISTLLVNMTGWIVKMGIATAKLIASNPYVAAIVGGAAVIGGAAWMLNRNKNKEVEGEVGGEEGGDDGKWSDVKAEPNMGTFTGDGYMKEFQGSPGFQALNQGGFVSGPSGVDKVPARLTAGEFVMSKGAVDTFGAGMMSAMNSMGGGTNRPTIGRYEGGGLVQNNLLNRVSYFKGGGLVKNVTSVDNSTPMILSGATTLDQRTVEPPLPPSTEVIVTPSIAQDAAGGGDNVSQANAIPPFLATTWGSLPKTKTLGFIR